MYAVKCRLFLISLLSITVFLPIDNLHQSSSTVITYDEIPFSSQIMYQDSSLINLLFSFVPSERNDITRMLNQYNPSHIHFYRNFPIGFVTLPEKTLPLIQQIHPEIYSRLHHSQKIEVIPAFDQLYLNEVTRNQDSGDNSPASIIRATELWNEGIDGSGVSIAIIDSGIDGSTSHGDFDGRIIYKKSFVNSTYGFSSAEDHIDYHGHGTHVAGIAAGGGTSYSGVAKNAELVNLKAANMAGHSTQEAFIAAIDEAISLEVDVISISIGFDISSPWSSGDELSLAVDKAVEAGIAVVIAAGNEGSEGELASINTPASAQRVITVGATNGSNNVASFSSRGPSFGYRIDPDVVAPGKDIFAPLAPGCVIELAYESLAGVDLGNYIPLSGTSMAAPVVSGAIALLIQQFPNASPAAIRAALQESAVDMDEDLYTQGSGLIEVAAASSLLKNIETNGNFNIISSLPRATSDKPVEFAERVTFPGDSTQMGISLVTGTGGTITWDISSSIEQFVVFNTTPQVFSKAGYYEKSLNISIPFDIAPGTYQGDISYTFLGSTFEIPLVFRVKNPTSKIYWDIHYTGKDDSTFYNYRDLDDFLASNLLNDINEYESALTWENLSQNDILVLTDLEYPISGQEISTISKFHEQNGSILLLTSAFPYFNPDPYNKLTEALGIPVNFSDRIDLVNYSDDGRTRSIIPFSSQGVEISWDSENPLFEGVKNLPLVLTTGFKGNQSDPDLKHLAQVMVPPYLVAAAYEPSDKGKILILGSENWFYSSFLRTSDGKNFTKNVFNWLKPETGITVNSRISQRDRQLEISAYYSKKSPLSVDIYFSNGSSSLGNILVYNDSLQHHELVISLAANQNQTISITIKNSNTIMKEYELIDVSHETLPIVEDFKIDFFSSPDVLFPSWAETDFNESLIDQGFNISITHSASNRVRSILLISSQLEDSLDVIIPPLDALKEIVVETELDNDSLTQQTLSWILPDTFFTGYYSYEVQVWFDLGDNSTILLKTKRGLFYIPDPEPSFNIQSTVGGESLEYYRNIESSENVPLWKPGEDIELRIIGQDNNSNKFKVHVQVLHYYLWLADRTVLDYYEIPASTNSSEHIGSFNVPSSPIPLPGEEELEVELYNQPYVLLIFIRDMQGNYDLEAILFSIEYTLLLGIDPSLIAIFGVITVVFIFVAVIVLRKRARSQKIPYSLTGTYQYEYPPPSSHERFVVGMRFCHNCGEKVVPQAKFCNSCGTELSKK